MIPLRYLYLSFLFSIVTLVCLRISSDKPAVPAYAVLMEKDAGSQTNDPALQKDMTGIFKQAIRPTSCQPGNPVHPMSVSLSRHRFLSGHASFQPTRDFTQKRVLFMEGLRSSYLYLLQKIII